MSSVSLFWVLLGAWGTKNLQVSVYTHRKKVVYEEPFRVLQPGINMEPVKMLQRTPIQTLFREPMKVLIYLFL